MTKYTKFEAIFRNETLVFTVRFRVKRRGCFSGRCSSLRRTIPSGKATVWC